MKLLKGEHQGDYIFECAGCKCGHLVTTERKNERGAQWRFNGNMDEPTFHPSIHIYTEGFNGEKQTVCHCIITSGFIQFLNDCAHDHKGKMIPMFEYKD